MEVGNADHGAASLISTVEEKFGSVQALFARLERGDAQFLGDLDEPGLQQALRHAWPIRESPVKLLWPAVPRAATTTWPEFVDNVSEYWMPSRDDIIVIAADFSAILVLDHEERLLVLTGGQSGATKGP
jgi:hypothetical protein